MLYSSVDMNSKKDIIVAKARSVVASGWREGSDCKAAHGNIVHDENVLS